MEQEYRINAKLRRRNQPALDQNRVELKSEDYDDDLEFCAAVAADLYERIKEDRAYLEEQEDEDDHSD